MTFFHQFSGKTFWWTLVALVGLDVISFFTLHSTAETVLFFCSPHSRHWHRDKKTRVVVSDCNGGTYLYI